MFTLVFQSESCLTKDGDYGEYISTYSGVIRYMGERDVRARPVGRFVAHRLHVDQAINDNVSLFDICDADSQEMHDLYSALFDPDANDLKDEVRDQLEATDSDLLIIDYIILNPKWRELNMVLLGARRLLEMLGGGCGLTVSDICPLSHDAYAQLRVPKSWLPVNENEKQASLAHTKLGRHFERRGFVQIADTPYQAFPMCLKIPSISKVVEGEDE
jgi:hypothetical protein